MIKIVSDTSTLYSTTQAKEAGFRVSPLAVSIAGKSYKEFDEINSEEFVSIIKEGHLPISSQPSIGDVVALYEEYPDDEILNISMAMGLSGTYQSAVSAAELCGGGDRIQVINTRTLCGPHRYLVEKAVEMAKNNRTLAEIREFLEKKMDTAKSYLMPADFDYLRRGGRLSPLVSHLGKVAGLAPAMTQTEDGTRLTVASIKRGFPNAIKFVASALQDRGVGKGWLVSVSHAAAMEKAEQAVKILRDLMPEARYEILPLSPAFITQGGPGCIAVQVIEE